MSTVKPVKETRPGLPEGSGEVPADLRDAGWELKEHVDEAGSFQMKNRRLKLATSPAATPQLAFQAARALQQREDRHKAKRQGGVGTDGETEADPRRGAVSRTFTQTLKVKLSPDGLQGKCAEFDALCSELEQMELEHKKVNDRFKEDLKAKDAEKLALERIVRKQYVETEVECEERMDYDAKTVKVVRLDTNEVTEERDMRPEELQQRLISV